MAVGTELAALLYKRYSGIQERQIKMSLVLVGEGCLIPFLPVPRT